MRPPPTPPARTRSVSISFPRVPARIGLLGLGSNLGDRRAQLQGAVARLPAAGVEVEASSSVYDTDPVGELPDQPSFLNACLRVRTALEPLELLDAVKGVERELGRAAGGPRHGPRAIDIDVLTVGDIELRHKRMHLPHEQLLSRRFVLIPALELDMELRTPDGSRLADALAALPLLGEGVRWAGPPLTLPRRAPAATPPAASPPGSRPPSAGSSA
jgi:2-amino-4-hydroxy-6-hydroxymethyldihydropteridine diphosphokinase